MRNLVRTLPMLFLALSAAMPVHAQQPPNPKPIGPMTGSGTAGQIPVYTGTYTIGDSPITAFRGRVGIGTTNLTSMLTVAGIIESTAGFRFSDGTVQTTMGLPFVLHGPSLAGMGTKTDPLAISPEGVDTSHLAFGAVTAAKLATKSVPVVGQVLVFGENGLFWKTPTASIATVTHDKTLSGDGNETPLGIAVGGVGRTNLADGAVTASKIADGQVVKRLNGLSDDVTISAGGNITITPSGNTLTISAADSSGISRVLHDATLVGDGTGAMPLGLSVPLVLTATSNQVAITGTNDGGIGIRGTGGIGVLGTFHDVSAAQIEEVHGAAVGAAGGDGFGVTAVGRAGGVQARVIDAGDGVAGVVGIGGGGSTLGHASAGVIGAGGGSNAVGGPDTSGGVGVKGTGGSHPSLGGDGVIGIGFTTTGAGVTTGGNGVVAIGGDASNDGDAQGIGGTAIMGIGGFGGADSFPHAGYFVGKVEITGPLVVAGVVFKIDHPLDPANKVLTHSGVESPDMKTIYDGVVSLDADGSATVDLPDWFGALNGSFRYQLTSIGAPAPGLYVASEIEGNHFSIGGGAPGMKVSWQVTGIRQDAYAKAHQVPVEEDKPELERGTYLHPEAFDQPAEKGVEFVRHPDVMRVATAAKSSGSRP